MRHVLPEWVRIPSRSLSAVLGACVTSGEALACSSVVDDGPAWPSVFTLLLTFVAAIALTSLLTMIVWMIARLAFRHAPSLSVSFLAAGILSLLLALFCQFALPEFESVFSSFGADLPIQTEVLMSFRYVLLLPLLYLLARGGLRTLRPSNGRLHMRLLTAEVVLLALALWCVYSPVFKLC